MTDAARRGWAAQIQHEIKELAGVPDLIGRDGTRLSVRLTTLLTRQHAAVVRLVKKMMTQRADEYMADSENTMCAKQMRSVNNGRAWAIKDLRDDLLDALEKRKGGG